MFFKTDIDKAMNKGWTPKEVFRLGIYSKEHNPQLINRISETEERINKMVKRIDRLAKENFELNKRLK